MKEVYDYSTPETHTQTTFIVEKFEFLQKRSRAALRATEFVLMLIERNTSVVLCLKGFLEGECRDEEQTKSSEWLL